MKSKLIPLVACWMLYSICVGEWSSPVPLLGGSSSIEGQSLVAGSGDTMWATVVSTLPYQVLACWTTGDTWSRPVELTPLDSIDIFHDPGMGRDATGRLWAAWYKDYDSSGVWTAFRDSAGWHAPLRAYSGYPAAGPMSFAADAQGNWYLGFAILTPYSSAVYCRWDGDFWESANYIAQGVGNPIETNFPAPTLVTRPDSGLWVVYEIDTPGDSFALLSILQGDSLRWCWYGDGNWPAATADSSGRLWIIQSLLGGFLTQAVVIDDSVEVGNDLVTEYSVGRARSTTDLEGIVWAAWQARGSDWVAVNYSTGGDWSEPEQTSALASVPKGIAADANGRVYVLFRTTAGQLFSAYRTSRPGVQEPGPRRVVWMRLPTVVRGVLHLGVGSRQQAVDRAELLDISGRKVLDLHAGENDVRHLAPGVYFIREAQAQAQAQVVRKILICK
jgi:hypothetical protein